MIEAEAPEKSWNLIKFEGGTAPTEEVVSQGLEAAKPFIKVLVQAQQELAAKAAKETQDFPTFPDYQDDAYAAVEGASTASLSDALSIADKQTRENRLDEIKAEVVAQLCRAVRGSREGAVAPRTARCRRSSSASASSRTASASTAVACGTSARSRPRSRSCPACTARRSSSAARPRSWVSPR